MPALMLLAAVLGGILFWVLRVHGTVRALREVDRDTKGLQGRARSVLHDTSVRSSAGCATSGSPPRS